MEKKIIEDIPKQYTIHFSGTINNVTSHNLKSTIIQAIKANAQSINLIFASDGGDLYNSVMLSNFLQTLPVPLKIYNFSDIESAAILIYLSANERFVVENGTFLIHSFSQYYNNQYYEYFKVKERASVLEHLVKIYIKYYEKRTFTAKTPLNINDILTNNAKIINAETAIECGLATQIITPSEIIMSPDDIQWCVPPQ